MNYDLVTAYQTRLAWRPLIVLLGALLATGCHKAAPADKANSATVVPDKTAAAGDKSDEDKMPEAAGEPGVALKPEDVQTMGITTTAVQAVQSAPEVQGFGVVLPHESIAIAVAEVRTAAAAERQSLAALARTKRLAGTPGAMPAEIQETAERQAVADQTAMELARQKLSSVFGLNPPWKKADHNPQLLALASGRAKLVHVTFPLGVLGDTDPSTIRLSRIDGSQGGKTWQSRSVWHAPADATVPGRSYFAILQGSDTAEGDHLLAFTPLGEQEDGVLVPASAALISGGKFYCYIEEKPGTFVKTEFDPGRPTDAGYFVKNGVSAGDKVVTHAAGLLLARETNPAKESE